MSNQLQITGGAKVRDLNDVIIGTNGVLSSLAFNVANGVPKLDSNGKILVSQLPNSVMEYLGTWNAATNTPYLVNGVGNAGDVYLVSVAGTHDFGAGPITFAVSDQVIYSGSIWQKASGASGTVTSVGLSTSGTAFTIGSSPVTTSGTITINGAGTASQYINGAGNLTTFPTLISSIGLSMPSAFSVSNSPLTANGTISVTAAGTVSQYIDGTGALQSFPSLTGYVPYVGATTDVDLGVHVLNAQALHVKGTAGAGHLGLKHQTATPTGSANESLVFANVDGDLGWQNGNLYSTILNTHSNTANRVYTFPNASGTLALTSDINYPVTSVFGRTGAVTAQSGDYSTTLVTEGTNLYYTDARARAALSFVAGSGAYNSTTGVITIPTNNNQITNGANYITLTSLSATTPLSYNNTTGAFSISQASTTVSGYLSSTDFTTFSNKQGAITLTTTGTSGAATFVGNTLNIPNYNPDLSGYVTLGTNQTISGSKTFSVQTNFNAAIYVQNAQPLYLLNSGNTYQIGLFASLGLSGNRTIYFPNADGTLALTSQLTSGTVTSVAALTLGTSGTDLSSTVANSTTTPVITLNVPDASATARGVITTGTQTIAGNKTFTGLVTTYGHNINKDATTGYGLNIQSMGSLSIAGTGYVSLTSNSTSALNIYYNGVTNSATLSGASLTAGRTFTFPDSSGTFALTSNLSSYLPLSGGSLTGNLSTNSYISIQNGLGTNQIYLTKSSGDVYGTIQTEAGGNKFSLGNVSNIGTLGTPNITWTSGMQVGINNISPSYTLDVTGTLRTTGAATFSSTISAGAISTFYSGGAGTAGQIRLGYDATAYWQIGRLDPAGTGSGNFQFKPNAGTSVLDITTSGNVGIGTTSPVFVSGYKTLQLDGGTTGCLIEMWANGSRAMQITADTSNAYFYNALNTPMIFYTNATERMRITSGGNVLIGTTTDNGYKLRVNGTAWYDGNITINKITPGLILNGTPFGNSGAYIDLDGWASAYKNWRFSVANYSSGVLEIVTSTSAGGTTFGTLIATISESTGAYTALSDKNKKKDFEESTIGLNAILGLKPTLYRMKDEDESIEKHLGFIAQEVKPFVPQAYVENGSFIGLQDRPIIAALVKAIQELSQQNQDLKSRLDKAGL